MFLLNVLVLITFIVIWFRPLGLILAIFSIAAPSSPAPSQARLTMQMWRQIKCFKIEYISNIWNILSCLGILLLYTLLLAVCQTRHPQKVKYWKFTSFVSPKYFDLLLTNSLSSDHHLAGRGRVRILELLHSYFRRSEKVPSRRSYGKNMVFGWRCIDMLRPNA